MKLNTQNLKNCIDVLQDYVDDVAVKEWTGDECPPKFTVSEGRTEDSIYLTIDHLGYRITDTIFPNGDYGNVSVLYVMRDLYNTTM